jgi:hypothetical protein
MKGTVWNIRGLNKRCKLLCILLVFKKQKESFEDSFLGYANKDFNWHYLPSTSTTGSILVGLCFRKFEVLSWQNYVYSMLTMIKNVDDKSV